jgi:serine/threonine protein kinase/Tol biopolymer transport system component
VTNEQWHRVKTLFQAAVERPPADRPAFLASAAGDDEAIRREVESLLAADVADDSVFDLVPEAGSAAAVNGTSLLATLDGIDIHSSLNRGYCIGPYEVVAPLGAGAMGQVYRARDTKLNREVALKVLPELFAADADRLARFKREAQMLAAVNHPSIAAIYGFEDSQAEPTLVLELVDGPTLADVIAGGPIRLDEALTIARQIADALEAAHLKGIIHRDLKPANIKITPAGVVKVLDFGLAKAAAIETVVSTCDAPQPPTVSIVASSAGVIVGTATYMSPEQASGLPVDRRTDIWAFGCVLFEMLTGSKAFSRDTVSATIDAILNSAAPLDRLPESTAPRVARLLGRCLEKDQSRRIGDISEVRDVIDQALASRGRRRLVLRTAGAIGVTAAFAAAVATYLALPREGTSMNRSDWVQITNLDSVTQPALSPDGRRLAFIRGSSTFTTNGQIYVKSLPNGEPVPLTRDTLPKMGAVFSPDGDQIAYTVTDGGSWDTWIVPVLGGEPRRWLRNASGLTWIALHRLLFSEIKSGQHMAIAASDETRVESRDVYVPKDVLWMAHRSYPSPDRKWVLVVEMDENGVWLPCRLVPLDGSSAGSPLGPPASPCTGAAWSPDGRWVYFSANAGDGFHIWRQRFPRGRPEQITAGPTEEEGLAIASDGKSLITSVGLLQRSVWVHDTSGERQISLEGYAYWPLLSASGRKLCFRLAPTVTTGQAPSQLWVADLSSGRSERLFNGQMVTGYDVSSSDDQVIASVAEADGKSRLWLAWLDGRQPAKPVPGGEGDNPRFGRNGDVFFRAADGAGMSLFRVRLDGTAPERITRTAGTVFGTISPDGRWVSNSGTGGMVAISTTDGTSVPILAESSSRLRWSPDGTRVYVSVQYGAASAFGSGRTYVIPLQKGSLLPPVPAGGFRSEADLAALPGVEILPHGDVALGPAHGVYAFSRTTTARNLYRIPLP